MTRIYIVLIINIRKNELIGSLTGREKIKNE
jgi:hypothetical protein